MIKENSLSKKYSIKRRGYSQIIAMATMVMLVVVCYGIYYVNSVSNDLWGSSVNTIMESSNRAGNMISGKIDSEQSILIRQKETLESMTSSDTDRIDAAMDIFDSSEYPIALIIGDTIYPKNSSYTFENLPDTNGQDAEIIAPYISENSGERVIALVHKLTFKDGMQGTLIREIAVNSLNDAFSVSFLRGRGHSYLINKDGDILFRSTTARGNKTSANIFTVLKNEDQNEKTAIDEIAGIVADGNSGWAVFTYNNENNLYYFSPVQSTDWYLVSVVRDEVLTVQTEHILLRTFILVGIILLGFAALIGLLIYREHQNLKLLENENTFEKQMLIESNSEVKTIILGINPNKDTYKLLSAAPDEKRRQTAPGTRYSELVSVFEGDIDEAYREEYKKRFSINNLKEVVKQQHNNEYYEFTVSINGEKHWIGAEAVAVHPYNHDSVIVYSERIIDAAKKEEEERRQVLENALNMAQQANQAKTTFLNSMSHDIRTPMNAIIGFTALAAAHIDDKEQVADYLQKISTSGNHLLSLINDILDMSRIESGSMKLEEKRIHLPEVLQDIRTIVQSDVDAKQLDFFIDTTDIVNEFVLCDKLHFSQIMLNLLSNAVKYTPSGGTIGIRVFQKPSVRADYACYEFHVKDTGIGMSEEFQEHVFETFTREQTQTVSGIQGTGLGMAIAKNIVDMMGGTISVNSKAEVGTEFIVTLQFKLCKKADMCSISEETAAVQAEINLKGKKVLLAEDNVLNREIATAVLEDAGVMVTGVKNGIEAVEAIAVSVPGQYDLILMDIQMPLMDGYTATREIRTLKDSAIADIPIIALTANAFDSDKKKALKTGMNGYVAKPISAEKLMEAMKQVLS